ncbi:hypothetical protein TPSD3_03245 [Thioflexithrix psekupsensis]|uniref:Uncharacterized protein n=1 Tax=Thioflexithrix psekupsensis TaxID=1570016 RepID=A0A251XBT7_9GAMM|nr:hypothetical protein TPSD3_03245 [Thioflexithrix psekupsensis]
MVFTNECCFFADKRPTAGEVFRHAHALSLLQDSKGSDWIWFGLDGGDELERRKVCDGHQRGGIIMGIR